MLIIWVETICFSATETEEGAISCELDWSLIFCFRILHVDYIHHQSFSLFGKFDNLDQEIPHLDQSAHLQYSRSCYLDIGACFSSFIFDTIFSKNIWNLGVLFFNRHLQTSDDIALGSSYLHALLFHHIKSCKISITPSDHQPFVLFVLPRFFLNHLVWLFGGFSFHTLGRKVLLIVKRQSVEKSFELRKTCLDPNKNLFSDDVTLNSKILKLPFLEVDEGVTINLRIHLLDANHTKSRA